MSAMLNRVVEEIQVGIITMQTKMEELMAALQQAFTAATSHDVTSRDDVKDVSDGQKTKRINVTGQVDYCNACPVKQLENLRLEIEGLSSTEAYSILLERVRQLPTEDYNTITVGFKAEGLVSDRERSKILLMMLQEVCNEKQLYHVHNTPNQPSQDGFYLGRKSRLSIMADFRRKASKTFSTSIDHLLTLGKIQDKDHLETPAENWRKWSDGIESSISNTKSESLDSSPVDESLCSSSEPEYSTSEKPLPVKTNYHFITRGNSQDRMYSFKHSAISAIKQCYQPNLDTDNMHNFNHRGASSFLEGDDRPHYTETGLSNSNRSPYGNNAGVHRGSSAGDSSYRRQIFRKASYDSRDGGHLRRQSDLFTNGVQIQNGHLEIDLDSQGEEHGDATANDTGVFRRISQKDYDKSAAVASGCTEQMRPRPPPLQNRTSSFSSHTRPRYSLYNGGISGSDQPQYNNHSSQSQLSHRGGTTTLSEHFENWTARAQKALGLDSEDDETSEEGSRSPSPFTEGSQTDRRRKMSWRLGILDRVVTSARLRDCEKITESPERTESSTKSSFSSPRPAVRASWRKAILETLLKIRMEKEKISLRGHYVLYGSRSIVLFKARQVSEDKIEPSLDYDEIIPCLQEATQAWEQILERKNQHYELPDHGNVHNAVKTDEVTNSAHQHQVYDDLLKQLTPHQHAILIDLGRTFPNHPYFSGQLGPGQLALFNLLKAYSLVDKDVGYCQGLSFVAGILLLHMKEEDAYGALKYLMLDLGFGKQYLPDMKALQVQLYQLSRLLHDSCKDLYDHFEQHDIAPTLYATPWFLTIFASQFPLGFVARVYDMIFLLGIEVVLKVAFILLSDHRELIKQCDSLETIVEFLKSTLPSMSIIQTEKIINKPLYVKQTNIYNVFQMDISLQLHAYEVEYTVLQEEMVPVAPPKNNKSPEVTLQIELTNQRLQDRNEELQEEVEMANSKHHTMEMQIINLKSGEQKLRSQIRTLELERDALQQTIGQLCRFIPPEVIAAHNIHIPPPANLDQQRHFGGLPSPFHTPLPTPGHSPRHSPNNSPLYGYTANQQRFLPVQRPNDFGEHSTVVSSHLFPIGNTSSRRSSSEDSRYHEGTGYYSSHNNEMPIQVHVTDSGWSPPQVAARIGSVSPVDPRTIGYEDSFEFVHKPRAGSMSNLDIMFRSRGKSLDIPQKPRAGSLSVLEPVIYDKCSRYDQGPIVNITNTERAGSPDNSPYGDLLNVSGYQSKPRAGSFSIVQTTNRHDQTPYLGISYRRHTGSMPDLEHRYSPVNFERRDSVKSDQGTRNLSMDGQLHPQMRSRSADVDFNEEQKHRLRAESSGKIPALNVDYDRAKANSMSALHPEYYGRDSGDCVNPDVSPQHGKPRAGSLSALDPMNEAISNLEPLYRQSSQDSDVYMQLHYNTGVNNGMKTTYSSLDRTPSPINITHSFEQSRLDVPPKPRAGSLSSLDYSSVQNDTNLSRMLESRQRTGSLSDIEGRVKQGYGELDSRSKSHGPLYYRPTICQNNSTKHFCMNLSGAPYQ